jgi:hypothetical protein
MLCCAKSTLFQMFQGYVACASYECCKSRSGYCTRCKSMFHLFFVLCCSKCFHVASSKCFMWMLHMLQWLYTYVASVLFSNVSDALNVCCTCIYLGVTYVWKCFIQMLHMFHTYIASVSSGCCICSAMATRMSPWCFIPML